MLLIEVGVFCMALSFVLLISQIFLTDWKWQKISEFFASITMPLFVVGGIALLLWAIIF